MLDRYTSLRDLLRVVRNKRTHFYEMPPETQAQMGPLPGGFLRCAFHSPARWRKQTGTARRAAARGEEHVLHVWQAAGVSHLVSRALGSCHQNILMA